MGVAAKRCYTCRERMVRVGRKPSRYECRNPECGKERASEKARAEQRRAALQGRKGTKGK